MLTTVTLWNPGSSKLEAPLDHLAAVQVGLENTLVMKFSTATQGAKSYSCTRQLVGTPLSTMGGGEHYLPNKLFNSSGACLRVNYIYVYQLLLFLLRQINLQ